MKGKKPCVISSVLYKTIPPPFPESFGVTETYKLPSEVDPGVINLKEINKLHITDSTDILVSWHTINFLTPNFQLNHQCSKINISLSLSKKANELIISLFPNGLFQSSGSDLCFTSNCLIDLYSKLTPTKSSNVSCSCFTFTSVLLKDMSEAVESRI